MFFYKYIKQYYIFNCHYPILVSYTLKQEDINTFINLQAFLMHMQIPVKKKTLSKNWTIQ